MSVNVNAERGTKERATGGGNMTRARAVTQACARAGVTEFVVCAGARNAPLVALLGGGDELCRDFKVYSFFEERSAAFFALGRIMAGGRPVAVVTTSGTAVAELLPAAVEAFHQGLPLILVTADRPPHYRGSGAPQAIIQSGIFSSYVEKAWDIGGAWSGDLEWSRRRPIHVNVCFDEPLLSDRRNKNYLLSAAQGAPAGFHDVFSCRRPLVLIGGLPPGGAEEVRRIVTGWRRPVYAEGPSQLRGRMQLEIPESSIASLEVDGVIRIGAIPTLRYWRDLETANVPVWHFSHLPFTGLPRTKEVFPLGRLRELAGAEDGKGGLRPAFEPWTVPQAVQAQKNKLESALAKYPLSEPGWVRWLSEEIPDGARVFLGNSLPVREWDLAAHHAKQFEIFSNRGVNGIDGLISTFLGTLAPGRSHWALIGDLSALYDLSAPWVAQKHFHGLDVNLVIINNGGGKIFRRLFSNPAFENAHRLGFGEWAKMWNLRYSRMEHRRIPGLMTVAGENAAAAPAAVGETPAVRVIEIIPSAEESENFWLEMEGKS